MGYLFGAALSNELSYINRNKDGKIGEWSHILKFIL